MPRKKRELAGTAASNNVVTESFTSTQRDPLGRDDSDRQQRVALAAYYRAERRGFEPGHEMEDWLAAEREIE